jgi:hypothetical protein
MTGDHGIGQEALPPFFIVGADRSGTTLLLVMLDRHPDVAIPGEGHFIPILWRQRDRYGTDDRVEDVDRFLLDLAAFPTFRYWGLSVESVRRELQTEEPLTLTRAIEAAYRGYARSKGKARWGDKTPEYVDHIPLLAGLFPEARFVHMIRDPRDVALSSVALGKLHRHPATSAFLWSRKVRRGMEAAGLLGTNRYHELHYEALLDDAERELRHLTDFLALPFDARMLAHDPGAIEKVPARMRHLHSGLTLPPTKGLRDWRTQMPHRDVEEVEAIAGSLMNVVGYQTSTQGPHHAARVRAWSRLVGFGLRYARRRLRRVARRVIGMAPMGSAARRGGESKRAGEDAHS